MAQGFSLLLVALLSAPAATPAQPDPLEAALAEAAAFVTQPILWGGEEVGFEYRLEGVRNGLARISGGAGTMSVYSRFLQVLEGDPRFTEVAMGASERTQWGWTFELTTRFTPGDARWPAQATIEALLEEAAPLGVTVEDLDVPRRWQDDQSLVHVLVVLPDADAEPALRRALSERDPPIAVSLARWQRDVEGDRWRKYLAVRKVGHSRRVTATRPSSAPDRLSDAE
jgi:hypothetical protein